MQWDENRRHIREDWRRQDAVPSEAPPIVDPTPVGLAAFALTMFLLSLINAGWLDQIGTFIPLALFYGGLVQLLSGMWAFRTNNTFGAVVFTSYGAFWLAFGFFFYFAENLGVLTNVGASIGWTLLGWTVFTLYVWFACLTVNRAVFIMFSVFVLTLLLLDAGFLLAVQGLIVAGGYTGILFAISAWYISAASFLNHTFQRTVLPLGPPVWQVPLGEAEQPPVARQQQPPSTLPQEDIQPVQPPQLSTTATEIRREEKQQLVGGSEAEEQEVSRAGTPAAPESQADAQALPIEDYDSLNTAEITRRLQGLSVGEIERLHDYEAKNKNRRTLIAHLKRVLRARRESQ